MDINRLKDPKEVEQLARRLQAAHIGHELVMTDNIYSTIPDSLDVGLPISHPVKIVGASIVFCLQGSITYKINLAKQTVRQGEVLIILPGSIMQVAEVEGELKQATISFASFYHEGIVDVTRQMRENPVIRLSDVDFEECMAIYRNLSHRLSVNAGGNSKLIAKGYLSVICNIIFGYWQNAKPTSTTIKSRPKQLYYAFLDKVQADYHSHRCLKHYAETLCVTPKYLSMVVKQESGRNASDFIDELLIFEAKALLMDGRLSVEQVAEILQFPNPSFFARFFKRLCGISPSAYRHQNK